MQSLHATGCQLHVNCTRVAASCMQIVPGWPPVACHMNKIDWNLHATDGHGTICMWLAATRVQNLHAIGGHSVTRQETSRQEVCKRTSLHHNYIFLALASPHPRCMLRTIQLTALGYLVWKMRWYYGWHSHTEANFAHASGQLCAKPPFFLQARCENNYLNKKMKTLWKNLRIFATHVLNKSYPPKLCMARSSLIRGYL